MFTQKSNVPLLFVSITAHVCRNGAIIIQKDNHEGYAQRTREKILGTISCAYSLAAISPASTKGSAKNSMGLCASKQQALTEPEKKLSEEVVSDDECEVENVEPQNHVLASHPKLALRTAASLGTFLKSNITKTHPQLRQAATSHLSENDMNQINVTFNVHSNVSGYMDSKDVMILHGLGHVERFGNGRGTHPSQLFADRLFAHYRGAGEVQTVDLSAPPRPPRLDLLDAVEFTHGYAKLVKTKTKRDSVQSVFNMYDLRDKGTISKADFRKMMLSLISSASLCPKFRIASLKMGIRHDLSVQNKEVMNEVNTFIDKRVFKNGDDFLDLEGFEAFMKTMREGKEETELDWIASPDIPVRSEPSIDMSNESSDVLAPAPSPAEKIDSVEDVHNRIPEHARTTSVMRQIDEANDIISHINHAPEVSGDMDAEHRIRILKGNVHGRQDMEEHREIATEAAAKKITSLHHVEKASPRKSNEVQEWSDFDESDEGSDSDLASVMAKLDQANESISHIEKTVSPVDNGDRNKPKRRVVPPPPSTDL